MADAGIKKIIIKKSDLPPLGQDNSIMVRYRIVSEDKNRVSHWSPRYHLISQTPSQVTGAIDITTKTVNVVWEDSDESQDREAYDIFVKVDNGSYIYYSTSYTHNFSFLKPTGSTISIAVQLESYKKERNSLLTIYSATESLV